MFSKAIQPKSPQLDASWLAVLGDQFELPYMRDLKQFLRAERDSGKVIFPSGRNIFNAFNSTPFAKVKVVILGQDPYHGPGQAHGLCFSVLPGTPLPPSLLNIFKEINNDLGLPIPAHGCLQSWAEQGVLLLNATLTVAQAAAGSHQGKGWERFTDRAIEVLNRDRDGLVFLLWGAYAQKKGALIDTKKHLILRSPHPSPLSAHRGFFGNSHFSLCNKWLLKRGLPPIDWRLDDKVTLATTDAGG